MAKLTIAEEVALAIAKGATEAPDNRFLDSKGEPAKVRHMDSPNDPLVPGDIIIIPENYKVLTIMIGDGENARPASFIFATVKSEDGSERNHRFFPNSLCKTVFPIIDGKMSRKVKTSGTATALYDSADTIDEGLALLKGKQIRVVDVTTYTVRDYFSKELKDTHLYTYDLV